MMAPAKMATSARTEHLPSRSGVFASVLLHRGQSLVQHCLSRCALSCWRPLVVAEEMQLFKVQLFKVQPLLGSLSVYFVIQYLTVKEFQGMLLSCYIELK